MVVWKITTYIIKYTYILYCYLPILIKLTTHLLLLFFFLDTKCTVPQISYTIVVFVSTNAFPTKLLCPYSFYILYCYHFFFHPLKLPTMILVCPLGVLEKCWTSAVPCLGTQHLRWCGETDGQGSLMLIWRVSEFLLSVLPNRSPYLHAEVVQY